LFYRGVDSILHGTQECVQMAERSVLGVKIVAISDTHGSHRQLTVPEGDILIHAGDFTLFGRRSHVTDFNDWLGSLPHRHKVVVNGNHEVNADWNDQVASMLTNATFLRDATVGLEIRQDVAIRVFGTEFRWSEVPCQELQTLTELGESIPAVDVLVCHNPALGYVDGDSGCASMTRLAARLRPRLVVSGHIHLAHGIAEGRDACTGITFVNAANAGSAHGRMQFEPVVIEL